MKLVYSVINLTDLLSLSNQRFAIYSDRYLNSDLIDDTIVELTEKIDLSCYDTKCVWPMALISENVDKKTFLHQIHSKLAMI
jgi:hypothetical protein